MNKRKIGMIFVSFISVALILTVVLLNQALTEEFFLSSDLNGRNSSTAIVVAFITALRLNNEIAYDITDPALWPRLDNWMETHEPQRCRWRGFGGEYLILGDDDTGYDAMHMCNIIFYINNISIEDGQIVDWEG